MSAAARSDCACVWTGALASGYPPEVPRFLPKLWLLLLASVLALGSSSALRLCVHEGSVGFEPAWVLCGEVAACCDAACEPEQREQLPSGEARDDGCRDYVVAFDSQWVPSQSGGDGPLCLIAWQPLPAASLGPRCPRRLLPPGRLGVPPPARPQRSPILRC